MWEEYTVGKQSYQQLAVKYGCSVRTIQRKIDKVQLKTESIYPKHANVMMDTTYFGRTLGVMVFKDSISGRILYKNYIKYETNQLYLMGILELEHRGITLNSIICDGRKGLLSIFGNIPVQMCQFHQVAIIRRYLTRKPKLQASIELWEHVMLLTQTDKESFIGGLDEWHNKWQLFLNERTKDPQGKLRYIHKRIRSAYRSLKTNLPWLFTFYDYPELKIPNTANAIDGVFSDLKNKLRNHNGLSLARKKKFIDGFFKA